MIKFGLINKIEFNSYFRGFFVRKGKKDFFMKSYLFFLRKQNVRHFTRKAAISFLLKKSNSKLFALNSNAKSILDLEKKIETRPIVKKSKLKFKIFNKKKVKTLKYRNTINYFKHYKQRIFFFLKRKKSMKLNLLYFFLKYKEKILSLKFRKLQRLKNLYINKFWWLKKKFKYIKYKRKRKKKFMFRKFRRNFKNFKFKFTLMKNTNLIFFKRNSFFDIKKTYAFFRLKKKMILLRKKLKFLIAFLRRNIYFFNNVRKKIFKLKWKNLKFLKYAIRRSKFFRLRGTRKSIFKKKNKHFWHKKRMKKRKKKWKKWKPWKKKKKTTQTKARFKAFINILNFGYRLRVIIMLKGRRRKKKNKYVFEKPKRPLQVWRYSLAWYYKNHFLKTKGRTLKIKLNKSLKRTLRRWFKRRRYHKRFIFHLRRFLGNKRRLSRLSFFCKKEFLETTHWFGKKYDNRKDFLRFLKTEVMDGIYSTAKKIKRVSFAKQMKKHKNRFFRRLLSLHWIFFRMHGYSSWREPKSRVNFRWHLNILKFPRNFRFMTKWYRWYKSVLKHRYRVRKSAIRKLIRWRFRKRKNPIWEKLELKKAIILQKQLQKKLQEKKEAELLLAQQEFFLKQQEKKAFLLKENKRLEKVAFLKNIFLLEKNISILKKKGILLSIFDVFAYYKKQMRIHFKKRVFMNMLIFRLFYLNNIFWNNKFMFKAIIEDTHNYFIQWKEQNNSILEDSNIFLRNYNFLENKIIISTSNPFKTLDLENTYTSFLFLNFLSKKMIKNQLLSWKKKKKFLKKHIFSIYK